MSSPFSPAAQKRTIVNPLVEPHGLISNSSTKSDGKMRWFQITMCERRPGSTGRGLPDASNGDGATSSLPSRTSAPPQPSAIHCASRAGLAFRRHTAPACSIRIFFSDNLLRLAKIVFVERAQVVSRQVKWRESARRSLHSGFPDRARNAQEHTKQNGKPHRFEFKL